MALHTSAKNATNLLQAVADFLFADLLQFVASLWITSFAHQLATSLLTTELQQTCHQQASIKLHYSLQELVDDKSVARHRSAT